MIRREQTLLASGLVRDVYLVEYEGQALVVKTLRNVDELRKQKLYLTMHKREVLTMDALKGHPNIVEMLGVCGTTVVTKFFKEDFKGSIRRRGAPMPIRQVVSLALGAAKGLQALHEIVGGIHFDMKPQQLLIDDDGTAVINDFNALKLMGRSPGPDEAFCAVHGGTPAQLITWRPPENYAGKPLTEKADIYSMGMIFYSVIAGRNPYDTPEALQTAVSHGSKPEVDPSWHRGFMEVVEQMWLDDPERRPSARQVVTRLTAIQEEVGKFVEEAPVE
ncbi:serine/threonine/tyrosine kinase [Ectocarpus siliculosus]|uniref:Serine/threonine/tyrosine kinase n=1 Tax=Ectocarpus siliculosus TaxID=2880 RepID=D8LN73_ECTSI|nr:serine/threonine/tyrosine kinase [Ectocarpus siliculosus]|eukprot:CBN74836.1 serine/threonine/tyrosine kinase [Ectocarpus siliculosus]